MPAVRSRRPWSFGVVALAVGLGLVCTRSGLAQTPGVPAQVQVDLISKLMDYERNVATRAGAVMQIVVLAKAGKTRSQISAEAFK